MLEIGQYVNSYRILRKIGEGGMGAVFEAVHEQIGRRAAIKVLLPQFARDPMVGKRFLNEARAVNLVEHPGLVEIYDLGQLPDGAAYIVMELIRGETLTARLQRRGGQLGLPEALHLLRQIASALDAAHEKGIVHRDLKPDNVMVVRDPSQLSGERIKVLDFGIAKLGESDGPEEVGQIPAKLTRTGSVMGTALYMAPEQCTGAGRVNSKADVYAVGAMFYQLLSGRAPFMAEGMGAIMAMHIYAAPPTLAEVGVSALPEVEVLIGTMLAKDPAMRPSMADVLLKTLELSQSFPFVRSAIGHDEALSGSPAAARTAQFGGRSTLSSSASQRAARTAQVRKRSRLGWVVGLSALIIGGGALFRIGLQAPTVPHAATGMAAPVEEARSRAVAQMPQAVEDRKAETHGHPDPQESSPSAGNPVSPESVIPVGSVEVTRLPPEKSASLKAAKPAEARSHLRRGRTSQPKPRRVAVAEDVPATPDF